METPTAEGLGILVGVLSLLGMEVRKQLLAQSDRRKYANGGNPIVVAVVDLKETLKAEQARTLEKLAEWNRAAEKRTAEHQRREEDELRGINAQLGTIQKRGEGLHD